MRPAGNTLFIFSYICDIILCHIKCDMTLPINKEVPAMGENYITCQGEKGSINISEDVLYSMVRAAVGEIDGVAALSNNAGTEIAELLGIKNAGKGVKVQINEGKITVDIIVMVRYGSNVVAVAQQVQDAVTAALESMAGMGTPVVNVHVSGVAFDK